MIIQENQSLKNFNTFGIDVSARYFAKVHTIDDLKTALTAHPNAFILGGGSNVLFTRDISTLVIHNALMGIEKIDENNTHVFLKVGAGENWHRFVLYCLENNYAGVENLSLIPGTVGAAPMQNIGAYGVEVKDVIHEVHTLSKHAPYTVKIFSQEACAFGYRDSIFKQALKNQLVITGVIFKLNKHPVFHTEYGAITEKIKGKPLSIQTISDAIIAIRREKLPDPAKIGNAGSFFKNPLVDETVFLTLQKKYPAIPHFKEKNNAIKIPAGWLIEQCGLKGKRFGHVGVHEHQALVLVNYGNGTGNDIKKLSDHIQKMVMETFGIELVTEVNVV